MSSASTLIVDKRRAELVRGARTERAQRDDALVAQRLLACARKLPVALVHRLRKRRDVVRDEAGADDEHHPHADQVLAERFRRHAAVVNVLLDGNARRDAAANSMRP